MKFSTALLGVDAVAFLLAGYKFANNFIVQNRQNPIEKVFSNELEISEICLDKIKEIDEIKDAEGNTLLLYACREGKYSLVEELLKIGADQFVINSSGWQAIHLAALAGYTSIVELLIYNNQKSVETFNSYTKYTPLHIAATKNNYKQTQILLSMGANINAASNAGHTPLIIASCNGFVTLTTLLVEKGANLDEKTSAKRETALYLASRNGYTEVSKILIENGCDVNCGTLNGSTPLHAAVASGTLDIVKILLQKKSNPNISQLDGSTPLHIASIKGQVLIAKYLLESSAHIDMVNKFGKSPLHEAAFNGDLEMVKFLLEKGASVNIVDNDGMSPLHTACSGRRTREGKFNEVVDLLLKYHANVNLFDTGNCTSLHVAACGGEKTIKIVEILLQAGADVTLENVQDWTPLHSAYSSYGCKQIIELMTKHLEANNPQFLQTFDPKKPKSTKERAMNISRLSEIEQKDVLRGNVTIEGIAKRIIEGRSKNIIVLTGAGISVSAGIPDFRSPKTGIYSSETMTKYNLPSPAAAFDLQFLQTNPFPFFSICKEVFYPIIEGKIKPTITHKFISLLYKKGLLLRNYTQNIDALEQIAGLPQDLLVESHGSFSSVYCIQCKSPADLKEFWDFVSKDQVPHCRKCDGIIRPNIVFFGEQLPARFMDLRIQDFSKCDLLIVMGTSLVVYPFAALVNDVSEITPRLLFNKDPVGPFTRCDSERNFRDVAVIGPCDDGVQRFASLLGWEEELMNM